MRSLATSLVILFLGACGFAAQITVDLTALSACQTGETNGWSATEITTYASAAEKDKPNIHFSVKESRLLSPVFDEAILKVSFRVRSSAQHERDLYLIPYDAEGVVVEEKKIACDYSESADAFMDVVYDWSESPRAIHQLGFDLEQEKRTTWTISHFVIETGHYGFPTPPENLTTSFIGSIVAHLVWTPGLNCATTRLMLEKVPVLAPAETNELHVYSLDKISNDSGNPIQIDSISLGDHQLMGDYLYVPARSKGEVQLSTGENRGTLLFPAVDDYRGVSFICTAHYYSHKDEAKTMTVEAVSGSETNQIATLTLTEDYQRYEVPLENVVPGAQILINGGGKKTNHRILFTEFGLWQMKSAQEERTLVGRFETAAARLSLHGLEPRALYEVTAETVSPEGKVSATTPGLRFEMNGKDRGLVLAIH